MPASDTQEPELCRPGLAALKAEPLGRGVLLGLLTHRSQRRT